MPTKVSTFLYASGALVCRSDSANCVCWINSEFPTIVMEPYTDEGTPVAIVGGKGVNVFKAVTAGVDVEDTSYGGAGERVAVSGIGEDDTVGVANVGVGSAVGIGIGVLQALKYIKAKLGPITHCGDL